MKASVCAVALSALIFSGCTSPGPAEKSGVPGPPASRASAVSKPAGVQVVTEHLSNAQATPQFKFTRVPPPYRNDAAVEARIRVVSGEADYNSGGTDKLNDGAVPTAEDQPEENFFFAQGADGGRFTVDLRETNEIAQVNTYSWHPGTRGPQVYQLYASDGAGDNFNARPSRPADPESCGWKLLARVDTRPKNGEPGGQYGVSIADSRGPLGNYRYLLFDCSATESADAFGNTFYSEIDVIPANITTPLVAASGPIKPFVIHSPDGQCEIDIDTSRAPSLTDWAEQKLAPVLAEWYPKISAMLPSEGFAPPAKFTVAIRPGQGVAATGGTRVTANSTWLKAEIGKQAIGALLHEEVHVVQQYGRARRNNPNATRSPGWLVEGIPDYIRWFKYEPQSHGADLVYMRRQKNYKYDGSYRVSANFLNWVTEHYDKDIVKKLNAAMREGKYSEDIWKEACGGKTVQELGAEWKESIDKELHPATQPASGS
jgi:hypothetical protein